MERGKNGNAFRITLRSAMKKELLFEMEEEK